MATDMRKVGSTVRRIIVGVVVIVVVAGVAVYFLNGPSNKTVKAHFAEAIGLYPGTPVKILGVQVGKIDSVTPSGTDVIVTMEYDSAYKLPANVQAIEVANSLVSDRYVALTPAYQQDKGGAVLNSGGSINEKHTGGPAELDQIYGALNDLSKALGPTGVNKGGKKSGALSTLLRVGAANLKGNGAALGNSITQLSRAASTLAGSRGNLFRTVSNLATFTKALKQSDGQVRKFNRQLAQVTGDLASERGDLGAALHDLGIALNTVKGFIKNNRGRLHTTLRGLASITGTLVRQKSSVQEALAVAPIALANITHSYSTSTGTLRTRSNLSSLTDPTQFCSLLKGVGLLVTGSTLLGGLTDTIVSTCTTLLSKPGLKLPIPINLGGLLPTAARASGSRTTASSGGTGGLDSDGLPTLPIGGSSR